MTECGNRAARPLCLAWSPWPCWGPESFPSMGSIDKGLTGDSLLSLRSVSALPWGKCHPGPGAFKGWVGVDASGKVYNRGRISRLSLLSLGWAAAGTLRGWTSGSPVLHGVSFNADDLGTSGTSSPFLCRVSLGPTVWQGGLVLGS